MRGRYHILVVGLAITLVVSSAMISPQLSSGAHEKAFEDRFRRGHLTETAANEGRTDSSSLRRQEDHLGTIGASENSATIASNALDEAGLSSLSSGTQSDYALGSRERNTIAQDHVDVGRHASSMRDAGQAIGSLTERESSSAVIGGPVWKGDQSVDSSRFNRVDQERVGHQSDYGKVADRSMTTFDRGIAWKSADASAKIGQNGATGGGSMGFESGRGSSQRDTGAILKQQLAEAGLTTNQVDKSHDAIVHGKARRGSVAIGFGEDLVGSAVHVDHVGWDRGGLSHRDRTAFQHDAYDNALAVNQDRSKAAVDAKVAIGQGLGDCVNEGQRLSQGANSNDRVLERDSGDRLTTRSDSTTATEFDIGGKTVIKGPFVAGIWTIESRARDENIVIYGMEESVTGLDSDQSRARRYRAWRHFHLAHRALFILRLGNNDYKLVHGFVTQFIEAAGDGDLASIERLLQKPCIDGGVRTRAFKKACESGRLEVVERLLLEDGVIPNAQFDWSVRVAAANNHVQLVDRLLQLPTVDPTARDNWALVRAAERGHSAVLERLLGVSGIDPGARNNWSIVKAAENGVDPTAIDNEALKSAIRLGHADVVCLLLADDRVRKSIDDFGSLFEIATRAVVRRKLMGAMRESTVQAILIVARADLLPVNIRQRILFMSHGLWLPGKGARENLLIIKRIMRRGKLGRSDN